MEPNALPQFSVLVRVAEQGAQQQSVILETRLTRFRHRAFYQTVNSEIRNRWEQIRGAGLPVIPRDGIVQIHVYGLLAAPDTHKLNMWLVSQVRVFEYVPSSDDRTLVQQACDVSIEQHAAPTGYFDAELNCTWRVNGPTSMRQSRLFAFQLGEHLVVRDLLVVTDFDYVATLAQHAREIHLAMNTTAGSDRRLSRVMFLATWPYFRQLHRAFFGSSGPPSSASGQSPTEPQQRTQEPAPPQHH